MVRDRDEIEHEQNTNTSSEKNIEHDQNTNTSSEKISDKNRTRTRGFEKISNTTNTNRTRTRVFFHPWFVVKAASKVHLVEKIFRILCVYIFF